MLCRDTQYCLCIVISLWKELHKQSAAVALLESCSAPVNANKPSTDGFPLWKQRCMPSESSRTAGMSPIPVWFYTECRRGQDDGYFDLHSRVVLSSRNKLQPNKEKPPESVFYRQRAWKGFINQKGFVHKLSHRRKGHF